MKEVNGGALVNDPKPPEQGNQVETHRKHESAYQRLKREVALVKDLKMDGATEEEEETRATEKQSASLLTATDRHSAVTAT